MKNYLSELEGRIVKIHLITGDTLCGKLTGCTNTAVKVYELSRIVENSGIHPEKVQSTEKYWIVALSAIAYAEEGNINDVTGKKIYNYTETKK